MKCIPIKRFLLISFSIIFLSILITFIITHNYYINKESDEFVEEYISDNDKLLEENIEQSVSDEEKYMEILKEKYEEKKILVLSFDDGPSKYTHDLIDELNKRKINATFFVLGENIEKFHDTLEFEVDSGNEIGIHSYKHKLFTKLTEKEIKEQINKTKDLIYDISHIDVTLIRVPYGAINDNVKTILENESLTNVLWDVDSLDWKFKNKSKTYNYMLKKIKGNDIILMHDSFKTSVDAAIELVDKLSREGYIFVTVSTLLELRNTFINENNVKINNINISLNYK